MMTVNSRPSASQHIVLPEDKFGKYLQAAIQQQKGYFALLQKNGYIDANVSYSDNELKRGLRNLLGRTSENFNSRDLSDEHIMEMRDLLLNRIIDENYIEIDKEGVVALVQQALNEKDVAKKTGFVREIMVLDGLARLKNELLSTNKGSYKITDTSPRGGFADSLRYDIGVAFDTGVNSTSRQDVGYVTNQLNLEIKANLDSFHITGFQGKTLKSNDAYAALKNRLDKELKLYFSKDKTGFVARDTKYFRLTLAEYAVKWKLGKIFPIFYRVGERGGGKQILLCTEYIYNITHNIGVTDQLSFNQIARGSKTAYNTLTDEEREELNEQQKDEIVDKAANLVIMSVSKYDLWYGTK